MQRHSREGSVLQIGEHTQTMSTKQGTTNSPSITLDALNASKLVCFTIYTKHYKHVSIYNLFTNSILFHTFLQPITQSELTEFISANYDASKPINQLIESILKYLSTKSSKFKYIINATEILNNEISNNKISSSFGSLWDEKNDGLLTVKFNSNQVDSKWIILNILFISI